MRKKLNLLVACSLLTISLASFDFNSPVNSTKAYASDDKDNKEAKDTKDKDTKETKDKDTKEAKDTKDKDTKETKDKDTKVTPSATPSIVPPSVIQGFGAKVISWREVNNKVQGGYLFTSKTGKGQFELKSEALPDKDGATYNVIKLHITSYLPTKAAFVAKLKNSQSKSFEAIVHRIHPEVTVTTPLPSPTVTPPETKDKDTKETKDKDTKDKDTKETKDKDTKDKDTKETKDKDDK